jgi:hypothetical protein
MDLVKGSIVDVVNEWAAPDPLPALLSAILRYDTHKVSAKRIQRILRHKSLSTTERYIQNINEDLEDTLELLSTMSVPQNGTPKQEKDQAANT